MGYSEILESENSGNAATKKHSEVQARQTHATRGRGSQHTPGQKEATVELPRSHTRIHMPRVVGLCARPVNLDRERELWQIRNPRTGGERPDGQLWVREGTQEHTIFVTCFSEKNENIWLRLLRT